MEPVKILQIDIGQENCFAVDDDMNLYKWGKLRPNAQTLVAV